MSFFIGLDIGGTKTAGAAFNEKRNQIAQIILPTPQTYSELVTICLRLVTQLEEKCGGKASVGVGIPGAIDQATGIISCATNTPCLMDQPFLKDLQQTLKRDVAIANDAVCAALSESVDGAGAGYRTVFGLIMGTGVGGGYIRDGKIVAGANGLAGEFGHLPLPFRESSDGPLTPCTCGQQGCIDKSISGPGLSRLYEFMTGKKAEATQIAELAAQGDAGAMGVLDQFYITIAKAMVTIIHTFDPEVIVVSGGLNNLPRMYDEVPRLWGRYAAAKKPKTKFVPAKHGATSGVRGAAWLGSMDNFTSR